MRSVIVLVAVLTVCLGTPRRPIPQHPNAELIDGAMRSIRDSRIINGQDVAITQFPWQASLRVAESGSHTCGASIISSKWLVSAAHCTQRSASAYVVGVGHEQQDKLTMHDVKRIINHKDYESGAGAYPNDISLIELSEPLVLNDVTVKAIQLANAGNNYEGQTCAISGWGLTKSGGAIPNTLQAAFTDVMSNPNCKRDWGNNINDGHVCVGGTQDEGSCSGDSGGPLACIYDGKYHLVGATSWGHYLCSTRFPSVYSRISHFREWIAQNTGI